MGPYFNRRTSKEEGRPKKAIYRNVLPTSDKRTIQVEVALGNY